jgi:hypothetical protein
MIASRANGWISKFAGESSKRSMLKVALGSAAVTLGMMTSVGVVMNGVAPVAYAQSNISGDLTGVVQDPSGAAISKAQVSVTSIANGQVKMVTTNDQGEYRVPLLSPGKYKISITAPGFETTGVEIAISAGTNTPITTKLTVGAASLQVEVSSDEVQLLHTDDAQISTTFDLQQIQNLPNPGNDLTFVAQTAPGAVMNTQGGYGNFSTNGLPATSNTFTVNGGYEGDPYLNVNNSGATNLLLGNNDVDQVTVTTNAYDSAFGGLGGAQVNEISRSGANKWHGNAVYWWNGAIMNANSYFNKNTTGTPSPKGFDNANQWAAAVGGPLKRDKIFGFVDYEGLRVIIPVRNSVIAPSPAWQAAILGPAGVAAAACAPKSGQVCYAPYGNLADNGLSSESSLYQTIFNFYNNTPGFSAGAAIDPQDYQFNAQSTNFGREYLINSRADFNLSQKDHLFIHSKVDHGVQPTETSVISPLFDAQSPQPSYEGQLSETHTFTPTLTNQFLFAASYYRAIFTNTNATALQQTLPFVLIPEAYATSGSYDVYGNFLGGADYAFPQGRNVTGYQFGDDLSWTKGKHNIKVGFNMRRDDITDYTSSEHVYGNNGAEQIILDPGSFAAGFGDEWAERFPLRLSEPVALYVMGGYVQDQWKPMPGLTLTAGLRMEHNSNPKCNTNCVSNFSTNFDNLPTTSDVPYNTLFSSGRKRAFFEQQNVAYEPRVGFALQPGGSSSKTTIRGGFGMFADYFPAQIMGDLLANVPNVDRFTVLGYAYGAATPLDPTLAGSGHDISVQSNAALQALFPTGGSYNSIHAAVPSFSRPTVVAVAHKVYLPSYEEWSLAVEHEILKNTVLSLQYNGNHGYHEPVSRLPNAYDPYGTNASLSAVRPNNSFGSVTEYYSGASSNYNGLIATLTSRVKFLTAQFNYAHGHALDEASNGGFDAFGVNGNGQLNPNRLADNYGNSDYDVHHYFSSSYAIKVPYKGGPHVLTDDWEVSGTFFHNSGYPFSVTDASGAVIYGTAPLAKQLDNHFNHHCGGTGHTTGDAVLTSCNFAYHFASSTDFGQQRRNQLYGPAYTDFDFDVAKGFKVPHWETARFKIGAQFFNAFNHPNFQIPLNDINDGVYGESGNGPNSLGFIYTTANTPTSILGAFLGGDASPRLIQFKGTFTF